MVNATAVLEKREHRGRVTAERVIVLRTTARPTPLVNPVGSCPGCPCSLSDCTAGGCGHTCCCPNSYSAGTNSAALPALVGTVVGTEAGA